MKSKINIFIFLTLFLAYKGLLFADTNWQEMLSDEFDIVETFDWLENWQGGTDYHWDDETMPKKLDGSDSIWQHYSNDTEALSDWIADHDEFTWKEGNTSLGYEYNGEKHTKSLCINYNNFVGGIDGYGPSRLGTYFGNGNPKSGYKTIYVFYMVKFRPGFFAMKSATEFERVGTLKFAQILSGFSSIEDWGTDDQRAQTCDKIQQNTVQERLWTQFYNYSYYWWRGLTCKRINYKGT